jgi:hypothetical protein
MPRFFAFPLVTCLALLPACGAGKEECDAAKSGAHKAWGELSVRMGVDQKSREDELRELESVLRVAEQHAAEAPAGALEAKRAEVAAKRAEVDTLAGLAATADKVRASWREATAAHAFALANAELSKFSGAEADRARAAGDSAVAVCAEVEE